MGKWYLRTTAKRYILSYLLVGLVPVVALGMTLCVLRYTSSRAALHDQLITQVESISAYYETLVSKVETISAHFSSNYYDAAAEDAKPGVNLREQLTTYRKNYALQGELFFYRRGLPFMETEEMRMDYADFEKKYDFGDELDMISFYTLVNSLTASRYTSTRGAWGASNFYVCMIPVPYLDATPSGTLVYFESIAAMRDSILNYLGDFTGYFCIQDDENRISYALDAYGKYDIDEVRYDVMALKGTPMVRHEIEGTRFVSFRVPSATLGFTYILSIPERSLYGELNGAIAGYIGAMSALCAMVLAVCVLLSMRLFRPIRNLERELLPEESDEEEGRARQDVFAAIGRQYQTVRAQNERLVTQLQSYTDTARAKLLGDLLAGRVIGEEQLKTALRASSVSFEHPHYYVVVFRLYAESGKADPAGRAMEYLREVVFSNGKAYGAETDESAQVALIVNLKEPSAQESQDDIRTAIARRFQTQLSEFGFSVLCAGVSEAHHSPLRLNQCLIEAYTAMAGAREGVCLYKADNRGKGGMRYEDCEMLRQCLLYGDATVARKTLIRILDSLREDPLPVSLMQARCFQIVNTVMSVGEKYESALDTMEMSLAASEADPERFREGMLAAVRALCECVGAQKEKTREDFSNGVIEYLYEHFAENALTAEAVADRFGVSESYVRKIVKDTTGASFANYVTALRFSQIKRQLSETNLPVKDIIERAGYMDVSSFTRKFKTQEGVTPGQYREMLRGEQA